MSDSVHITVPMTPPSVNTYVRHDGGKHYKQGHSVAFETALAYAAHGKSIAGNKFKVTVDVFLGPKQRPDVDNLAKLCLDGLAAAGVFRDPKKGTPKSDSHVKRLEIEKHDTERGNPRTEIVVEAL